MKNVLCWFGIIVLLGLVLFPPILRLVLPNKEEIEKKVERTNYVLACSNQRFIINTSYENNKVKMIIMKKLFTQQEKDKRKQIDENIENIDEQLIDPDTKSVKYQEINDIFEKIKNQTTIIHNVLDDGEVISIDFSILEHNELEINKMIQEINEQQLFYENIDFSCVIR